MRATSSSAGCSASKAASTALHLFFIYFLLFFAPRQKQQAPHFHTQKQILKSQHPTTFP
jgi:hypothetical protein